MEINIRTAQAQDYDSLCALLDRLDAPHRERFPNRFKKPDGPVRDRAYILGLLADEDVGLFVAERGGEVVGMVKTVVMEARPIPIMVPRRYAMINSISVKETARRTRIGQALMEKAQAWAIAKGAVEMELHVFAFNQEAISFYRNLGYETISLRMSKPLENQSEGKGN